MKTEEKIPMKPVRFCDFLAPDKRIADCTPQELTDAYHRATVESNRRFEEAQRLGPPYSLYSWLWFDGDMHG